DVLGFSSICSSYPLTLRIASKYKERQKDVKVVLGGPQASVTDIATMKAFPAIDFIIRGEAENSFISFIKAISQKDASELESIKGLTFRQGDSIIHNPDSDIILNLDSLPLPAYHLDPLINEYKSISLEVGRGCPFNCTFCSTSNYFGRKFRLKSPQKIIEQMKFIKQTYKVNNIGLDHDMFTANKKEVEAFCYALLDSGENFNWGCSARVDCIDDDLLSLMSKAGCKGIFFGIESASPRLQKSINKNLKLTEAVDRIQYADKQGISTAVSLITAFPDETEDELKETLNFFVESLRFNNAEPQIGLLAPLAGSPMYAKYKDKLELDYVFSEMAFQGWKIDEEDLELIRNNPEVFPDFYSIPNPWIDRNYFKEVRDFVTALQVWFRWIPVAMLQETGDILKVYKRWMEWRKVSNIEGHLYDGVPYYNHKRFADDFLEFTRDCYISEMSTNQLVISELTKTEGFFKPNKPNADKSNTEETGAKDVPETENKEDSKASEKIEKFTISSFPFQPENVRIVKMNID
ncbi:MAG: radical SAM protein, partial [Candidatus Poribacteria bacterium]